MFTPELVSSLLVAHLTRWNMTYVCEPCVACNPVQLALLGSTVLANTNTVVMHVNTENMLPATAEAVAEFREESSCQFVPNVCSYQPEPIHVSAFTSTPPPAPARRAAQLDRGKGTLVQNLDALTQSMADATVLSALDPVVSDDLNEALDPICKRRPLPLQHAT